MNPIVKLNVDSDQNSLGRCTPLAGGFQVCGTGFPCDIFARSDQMPVVVATRLALKAFVESIVYARC